MKRAAAILLLALAAAGCAPVTACPPGLQAWSVAELLFGRNKGEALVVSDADWAAFAADTLTPNFPDGLTVLDGAGQWRSPRGLEREPMKMVIIATPELAMDRIERVIAAYRQRFGQDSVGLFTGPRCVRF